MRIHRHARLRLSGAAIVCAGLLGAAGRAARLQQGAQSWRKEPAEVVCSARAGLEHQVPNAALVSAMAQPMQLSALRSRLPLTLLQLVQKFFCCRGAEVVAPPTFETT